MNTERDTDKIYEQPQSKITPFSFTDEVASVFDDMARRSIPCYAQVQDAIASVAGKCYKYNGVIYDLGCSTGTSLYNIARRLQSNKLKLTGIDDAPAMVKQCRQKLGQFNLKGQIEILQGDISNFNYTHAEMFILNYVLQFISPDKKPVLLDTLYRALPKGGVLFLSDKTIQETEQLNTLFTDVYYEFKVNQGYSELEISQKREALENVLTPCTDKELMGLLKNAGFSSMEIIVKHLNFTSIVAVK
ncbi:MAG: carboxy-S-adenosyl-L-methionine synthase CmoA [Fibrobacteria bacterium]|nr:carboxy-S-adenosyl-L-methionine synthase CmoA [Fibrobacteria bacterium]